MNPLHRNLIPLVAPLLAFAASYLAYDHLPTKIPAHWGIDGRIDNYTSKGWQVYFYPAAMVLVHLFFRFVAFADKGRTMQLREAGIFDPLWNGAIFLFGYAHLLSLGIGLGWVSPRANFLVGAASLTVLLVGGYIRRHRPEWLDSSLQRLNVASSDESRGYIGRCILTAGACGMAGTLTGRLQLGWLLIPLIAGVLLARRRFPLNGGHSR